MYKSYGTSSEILVLQVMTPLWMKMIIFLLQIQVTVRVTPLEENFSGPGQAVQAVLYCGTPN